MRESLHSPMLRSAGFAQALPAQGRLIQFTYALRAPSPWQQAGLQLLSRERVVFNLPPARVDVLAHPVQSSRWKAA